MNARVPVFAAAWLVGAYSLARAYQFIPEPRWVWIACLHGPIAVLVLWKGPKRLAQPDETKPSRLRSWLSYAGPIYLGLLILLGLLSRMLIPGAAPISIPAWDPLLLLTVLWIPWVEECIFRGGVGRWLQAKLGAYWGIYLSALFFATLHSSPPQNWIPPLGPFLLALCCELIVRISGRLTPAILLHACCNASPLVFALLDARWLSWLSGLYLDLN